jgi:ABC-type transport system involved in multi-copper enzyme maturation permease subunit
MRKQKGKPFLELFASALHEDYRFPILETFAFLYTLGTFVFANFGPSSMPSQALSGETAAYNLASSLLGVGASVGLSLPLFIFIILIFKNIAYGLGSDLEKGIIQTYFSYPLKRHRILTAKLLSALGIALILFLTIQISALYVLAPDIVLPFLSTVLLTYAANLSYPLLVAGIILLATLILRRGGLTLVVGIVLYFFMGIISGIAIFVAFATQSPLALQIISLISPNIALAQYYPTYLRLGGELWMPTFSEALLYIGASYVIVAFLFLLGYLYFSRRLGL